MKRLFPCWFTRPLDKIPQYFQRRIGYRHVYAIPEGCLRAPLQRHGDGLCCPLSNSPAELDWNRFRQFLCRAFPKKNEIQKGFAQPMYK